MSRFDRGIIVHNKDKHAFHSLFYQTTRSNDKNNVVSDHDIFWQCKLASYSCKLYPSLTKNRQQEQGVGEHTDSGFLTLMLQDDDDESISGGLQVI